MRKFMEKKLRKREAQLVDAGRGVILFGIWEVAQVNMVLSMSSDFREAWQNAIQTAGVDAKVYTIGLWVSILFVLLIQFLPRLYIGFSAVAEGKGRKKGNVYIVLTAALLVFNLHTSWISFFSGISQISVNMIVSFLLNAVSLYIMVELLTAGIGVKRLRKKMKR